jgi:polyphosphate kinase
MSVVARAQKVRVRSILGRFLEHSRIFYFHNDSNPEIYIGSADIMQRNLDRRFETLVSIQNSQHKENLIQILNTSFSDDFRHWELQDDDKWRHVRYSGSGDLLDDFQEYYLERNEK